MTGSPVTGNIPIARLSSELSATNVFVGTISVSAIADDDNNNSAVHPIGGSQYYLGPSVALEEARQHLQFNLAYSPGLLVYVPRNSEPDRFSQLFGGMLHYDFSKKLSIALRQDYLQTDNPFQQFESAPFQPGIGVINRPGIVSSSLGYTNFLSQAELNYKVAKHTLLGVNGQFLDLHHDHRVESNQDNNQLINTRDTSGSVFLTQQITPRQSIGAQYQLLNITFPGTPSRTLTNGVFLFDQVVLNPHASFSIFAGPQYSQVHNQELVNLGLIIVEIPFSRKTWTPAAGGTFKWQSGRTALEAIASRRVADGRGLMGSVEMTEGSLTATEKLSKRWVGSLAANLVDDKLLQVPGDNKVTILYVSPEISRRLAQNTWLRLSYQRASRTGYLAGSGNHNRVTLNFEHSFDVPLGR